MMDLNNVVALVNEDITTIKAKFNREEPNETPRTRTNVARIYTYKCPKTLALRLQPGDFVAVEVARGGFSVVEVVEIDHESDIDPHSDIRYGWAFAQVDTTPLIDLRARESAAIEIAKRARRDNMRKQAAAMLVDPTSDLRITDDKRGFTMSRTRAKTPGNIHDVDLNNLSDDE